MVTPMEQNKRSVLLKVDDLIILICSAAFYDGVNLTFDSGLIRV